MIIPNLDYTIDETKKKEKIKILIIPFFHGLGHVIRSLAVAIELKNRGHEILFACSEKSIHIPKAAGLNCKIINELPPLSPEDFEMNEKQMKPVMKSRVAHPDYISRCLEEEAKIIDDFKPDQIIFDFKSTTGVSAALAKVPSVQICHIKFFEYPLNEILPDIIDTMKQLDIPQWALNKIFGDVIAVPDLSLFDPLTELPQSLNQLIYKSVREIRYVGPILRKRPSELGEIDELKKSLNINKENTVFITFGGTAMRLASLRQVLRGLVDLDAHIIVITGPNLDSSYISSEILQLKSSKASIEVHAYTDKSLEYMKASDVAIIHGGHQTTLEGLLCGTPMIIVPNQKEQRDNAKKVVESNLGFILSENKIEEKIASLVNNVLDDTDLKQRSEVIANKFNQIKGEKELSNFIETNMVLVGNG